MWSGDSHDDARRAGGGRRRERASTCCASPTTTPSAAPRSWPTGCRAGSIVGEELRTHAGEIIGLFLTEHVPFGVSPDEAGRAHPRPGRRRLRPPPVRPDAPQPGRAARSSSSSTAGLVDAIEVFNAKTSLRHLNDRAAEFADAHDLAAGAGSDAHVPDALGAAYVEMPDFDGPSAFLAEPPPRGRSSATTSIAARPWTARIVPST